MTLAHPNLQSYYHRRRQFHRHGQEIKEEIMNHLLIQGPTSVTKISYAIQISHGQCKKFLGDLIRDGFVIPLSLKDLHLGRRRRPFSDELGHIAQLNVHVKMVFIVTTSGKNYLVKCNRLESMINWKASS